MLRSKFLAVLRKSLLKFRLRFESTRPKSPTTMENRIRRLIAEIEANQRSDWSCYNACGFAPEAPPEN